MSDLSRVDIEVFSHAIDQYFKQTTHEPAIIEAAYLADNAQHTPPTYGFTGVINVSAKYVGAIYFSAPSAMMRHVLTSMKENNQCEENLLDAVGEIANTISGNARKHFGEHMEISVPEKIVGYPSALNKPSRDYPYIILIKWKHTQHPLSWISKNYNNPFTTSWNLGF
ncbi:MAG: chemotaxis protein CheX [Methylotenera sp.]|nr:chemotaxis protein CheX [Methylotenera sp.]